MKNSESVAKLYIKYLDNTCTAEELDVLLDAFGEDEHEKELRRIIAHSLDLQPSDNNSSYVSMTERVRKRLLSEISQKREPIPVKTSRLWPRLAGIAAVALVVAGLYFYKNESATDLDKSSLSANDIAPGKVGATLTLASGERLVLGRAGQGEIANEAGVKIYKASDGQIVYEMGPNGIDAEKNNTLSTAKGETYLIVLPDKSKVWLNSASSLTYTTALLKKGVRRVKLTGEGYFEISKDKDHPFIVETAHEQVEVMGTHFNVNAYTDEVGTSTTLLEGSVKVSFGNKNQVLKPGFCATVKDNGIIITKAIIENTIDWKDGDFNLDGLDFKSAMRKIARWYDVEVVYDDAVSDNIISGGWISRDTKLSTILDVIERSGLARFRLEGRKLYVSK